MNQKKPSNDLATEDTASGETVAYRDGFSAGAKLIEEITAERDAARAQLAQRAGNGLEAPTVREFQNLDRGKLYDICCRQSHAIKEADKCIKRYQDKLRSGDAQPDSERDAALLESLREKLIRAHDALEGMSDSDIDHFETDEEEIEGAPAQYAARIVFSAIQDIDDALGA